MPKPDELLELLLANRNIGDEDRDKFLNPSYDKGIHNPYLMKDMEKAVVRIFEAIEAKEKIIIYSDYDCDGIPAAVIMHDFFKKIGYENFSVYIPDRHDEGYGLNLKAIDEFIDTGVNLIITFDLGITAIEEITKAKSAGIDTIVTDHHLPQDRLPDAFAIINPKQKDCNYPDKNLCGAGIAFKLVCAIIKKYGEYFKIPDGWEKWLLDMASVATLADQVPLVGENRILAYYGLKVLKKTRRPGLIEIFNKAGVNMNNISEEDITFTLAPRINAASRMGDPMDAFRALSSENPVEAKAFADHLSKINDERKQSVARIMKDVNKTLEKREDKSVIVIGNPNWRVGILGLVASKIVDQYKRTTFVWGSEGSEIIRGSCRGYGDINLVEAMSALPTNSLIDFGGHKGAGGFSVEHTEIHFLEERLLKVFDGITDKKLESVDIPIDAKINLDDVNIGNYNVIEKLAPYGEGNPKPIFLLEDITISSIKEFGKDKNHLEIIFLDEKAHPVKAISFFKTRNDFGRSLTEGERINLYATFEKSTFLGRTELRLRIVDII
jgi:single-stranded-DNA-specific exonuclease